MLVHVTARGNLRRDIFLSLDDRTAFLGFVAYACEVDGLVCHAFCLMTNHYHLLLETPEANLAKAMHRINCLYANRFNRVYQTEGHVFERPYRSWVVRDDRRGMVSVRYIVRNPIAAGLCQAPEHWKWSSHAATAGLEPRPAFLTTERVLGWFGGRDEAPGRYRAFVDAAVDQTSGRPSLEVLLRSGLFRDAVEAHDRYGYRLREIAPHIGVSPATLCRRLRSLRASY
jgi:REP element-mobilizing transposase RayT